MTGRTEGDEAARRRRIVASVLNMVGEAEIYARPDICRILDAYVEGEIDDQEVMTALLGRLRVPRRDH
jgi:hypothetical protein